jgi:hypothetical protein
MRERIFATNHTVEYMGFGEGMPVFGADIRISNQLKIRQRRRNDMIVP